MFSPGDGWTRSWKPESPLEQPRRTVSPRCAAVWFSVLVAAWDFVDWAWVCWVLFPVSVRNGGFTVFCHSKLTSGTFEMVILYVLFYFWYIRLGLLWSYVSCCWSVRFTSEAAKNLALPRHGPAGLKVLSSWSACGCSEGESVRCRRRRSSSRMTKWSTAAGGEKGKLMKIGQLDCWHGVLLVITMDGHCRWILWDLVRVKLDDVRLLCLVKCGIINILTS